MAHTGADARHSRTMSRAHRHYEDRLGVHECDGPRYSWSYRLVRGTSSGTRRSAGIRVVGDETSVASAVPRISYLAGDRETRRTTTQRSSALALTPVDRVALMSATVDIASGLRAGVLVELALEHTISTCNAPIVVAHWVQSLSRGFPLHRLLHDIMFAEASLRVRHGQSLSLFAGSSHLHIPWLFVAPKGREALAYLCTGVAAGTGAPFFGVVQASADGTRWRESSRFAFDQLLTKLLEQHRKPLLRDICCEVMRAGYMAFTRMGALSLVYTELQVVETMLVIAYYNTPLHDRVERDVCWARVLSLRALLSDTRLGDMDAFVRAYQRRGDALVEHRQALGLH